MRWECASNLNWEGDFSGCTFKENWENPLALLYYSVVVDPLEALGNRSAFEASFNSYLAERLGSNEGFDIVELSVIEVSRTGITGLTGFTLIMEITSTSQLTHLDRLDMTAEGQSSISILGKTAFFMKNQSYSFIPDASCSCPILWSELRDQLEMNVRANVTLCRAPSYASSPCECQELFQQESCEVCSS
jgi:hypothetical protein